MCHVAAWLVDGIAKPPHGKEFKHYANLAMKRVPILKITTTHDRKVDRPIKYNYKCQDCDQDYPRQRVVDITRKRCGKCRGKLYLVE